MVKYLCSRKGMKKKKFTLRKVKKYIIDFFKSIGSIFKEFLKIIKNTFKEITTNTKLGLSLLVTFIAIVVATLGVVFATLKPSINLKGEEIITLELNEEYKEPGYTSSYFNKDLTKSVKVENNVDNTKIGEYSIIYTVKTKKCLKDNSVKRIVKVVDKISPEITLEGKENINIYLNNEYKEPGYKAVDNYDGDITENVIITNNVDKTKIGEHKIIYKVSDSSNNVSEVERTIKVITRPVSNVISTTTVPTVTGTKGSPAMVELAAKQIGNRGGEPYWRWYGYNYRVEWCAAFISWLANELGYLNTLIPKTASVPTMVRWFRANGQLQKKTYEPKPGEIIFFDWNVDGHPDHVGLVEKVENGRIYTIEGNSKDECRRKDYPITSKYVHSYGTPLY